MIRLLAITCLIPLTCAAADDQGDLLRFNNSDQLHGKFIGIVDGPMIQWMREDTNEPAKFEFKNLRHLVLQGGTPRRPIDSFSLVELINGDRIPGSITRLDDKSLTLETSYAGNLEIPRDKIAMMAPNPLGGRVYYHGPFSEQGWQMINPAHPGGLPPEKAAKKGPPDEAPQDAGRWHHSGAAWYWRHPYPGTALIRRDTLPDRALVQFKIAWKNQLNLALALNADFSGMPHADKADPKAPQQGVAFVANDADSLPRIFGNSQILQINSNYMVIYRSSMGKDGNGWIDRTQVSSGRLRLGENSEALFELRIDRKSGQTSLFVNGDYITQWNNASFDGEAVEHNDRKRPDLGSGIGFMAQYNESSIRLSDIIIAEWNGMPDSARSMQKEDQDIVVLTNGLDRIAGKAARLTDDHKLAFEGKHGNFTIPLEEVAEVRFASRNRAASTNPSERDVTIRFSPMGTISGIPQASETNHITLKHALLGDIHLSTDPAVMLEFNAGKTTINDWDASF